MALCQSRRDQCGLSLRFTVCRSPRIPLDRARSPPQKPALVTDGTVRDLVSSEPYLHTGQMNTIEDVLGFYLNSSAQARAGTVRNADPQLSSISLDASAVVPLAAFLRALDEENYADIPCPCQ